ncbi:PREDICTED: VHS domain-containing protein At3g16270-like [Tarenaya hassleriana]|uniref:VHS domain-containing protein At3g16270-like n=1 Tax=Tarenaya hassleriana TaxID=28532 RepID=UPI00053C539D|nr:PREDICTED: VHS domain-containing protein At3g16270-like [Tarenaya hassleriana]
MDSSRRAVESYWRSRMIDAATSDEDKVTPVYKLEEICDLLRSSHVGIVKEVSEFILKRLDHRSPIVKQKALRLIKYAVGKSGAEFRREMQRNSVAVRNLLHYKGHPDPLKGDALNKAVRETAQEAVSSIFSEETSKPTAAPEGVSRRIQGFGNTNFEMHSEDKKSILSEVVGIGTASIKQGLSTFAQSHLPKKNEIGSYRGPNLHRSLTMEDENSSRYQPVMLGNDGNYGMPKNTGDGNWGQISGGASENSASGHVASKTREEKLLETIVTSGGVRLQPTRDALQVFLSEATKLDAVALSIALDAKLQSPLWQVRMKAVCVLEAILRKQDDDNFSIIATYFSENKDVIQRCSESPQSSVREKATRVLSLINGGQSSGLMSNLETSVKREKASTVDLPDLIDTGSADFLTDETVTKPNDIGMASTTVTTAPLMDDLFGDSTGELNNKEKQNDDDPFADVSFHSSGVKENPDDLFSGMTIGAKPGAGGNHTRENKIEPEPLDMFGSISDLKTEAENPNNINDLMGSLFVSGNTSNQKGSSSTSTLPENLFATSSTAVHQPPENPSGGLLGSQIPGFMQNPIASVGVMPFNFPPGIMLNPAFASQPFNYAAMENLLAQQQFLGSMSSFQQLGNVNAQSGGSGFPAGTSGGYPSPLPDVFQANLTKQPPTSVMNGSKKEDTRAFDFISDHVAAARDTKRVS